MHDTDERSPKSPPGKTIRSHFAGLAPPAELEAMLLLQPAEHSEMNRVRTESRPRMIFRTHS